jgi:hypothetical protein
MDEETLRDVTGFLRSLADTCKECHRRMSAECPNCTATFAAGLHRRLLAQKLPEEEDVRTESVRRRRADVIDQLRKAGRPLLAAEIVCDGCDASTKSMTLKRMADAKEIRRRWQNGKYTYSA